MKIELEISDEAFDLLNRINRDGFVEYRDRYESLEDYFNKENYTEEGMVPIVSEKNTEHFYKRNAGGTLYLIPELESIGLIIHDDMSWYMTYHMTDLGKQVLRDATINKILNDD